MAWGIPARGERKDIGAVRSLSDSKMKHIENEHSQYDEGKRTTKRSQSLIEHYKQKALPGLPSRGELQRSKSSRYGRIEIIDNRNVIFDNSRNEAAFSSHEADVSNAKAEDRDRTQRQLFSQDATTPRIITNFSYPRKSTRSRCVSPRRNGSVTITTPTRQSASPLTITGSTDRTELSSPSLQHASTSQVDMQKYISSTLGSIFDRNLDLDLCIPGSDTPQSRWSMSSVSDVDECDRTRACPDCGKALCSSTYYPQHTPRMRIPHDDEEYNKQNGTDLEASDFVADYCICGAAQAEECSRDLSNDVNKEDLPAYASASSSDCCSVEYSRSRRRCSSSSTSPSISSSIFSSSPPSLHTYHHNRPLVAPDFHTSNSSSKTANYVLSCEFTFLPTPCTASFHASDFSSYLSHTLSHFSAPFSSSSSYSSSSSSSSSDNNETDTDPPRSATCLFCDEFPTLTATLKCDAREYWVERLRHLEVHLAEGKKISDGKVDEMVWRWCREKGLLNPTPKDDQEEEQENRRRRTRRRRREAVVIGGGPGGRLMEDNGESCGEQQQQQQQQQQSASDEMKENENENGDMVRHDLEKENRRRRREEEKAGRGRKTYGLFPRDSISSEQQQQQQQAPKYTALIAKGLVPLSPKPILGW